MSSRFESAPAPVPKDASSALEKTLLRFEQGELSLNSSMARQAIETFAQYLEPAEREEVLASLRKQNPPSPSPTKNTQDIQAPDAENEVRESAESNIWDKYKNPALQQEIERLTPAERVQIDHLSETLAQEAESLQIMATKPLGAADAPKVDHVGFSVRKSPGEEKWSTLGQKIQGEVGEKVYNSLGPSDLSSVSTVAILDHPDDSTKAILISKLGNPGGNTSLYEKVDDRQSGHAFKCIIPKSSPTLAFLRSEKNGRLFPFIYRHAAVRMNEEALSYVDAPLSGHDGLLGSPGNPLVILDVPERTIIPYQDTSSADIAPFTKRPSDSAAFAKVAQTYIKSTAPPSSGWGQLSDRYRS